VLHSLPLRALVGFAARCAKRVEPLTRLQPLIADAYARGQDVGKAKRHAATHAAAHAATAATHAAAAADAADDANDDDAATAADAAAHASYAAAYDAADADDTYKAYDAYTAATAAADVAAAAAAAAAYADVNKLRTLNLGQRGKSGQPIRWNDPRLGPLWPNGEPKWYTEVVQLCDTLEKQLRALPDPNRPPLDAQIVSRLRVRDQLDQMLREGKLAEYVGEYVVFAKGQICGHGATLVEARKNATANHPDADVHQLVDYYVPGE
jgi:hypothetical protein